MIGEGIDARILMALYRVYKDRGPAIALEMVIIQEDMGLGPSEVKGSILKLCREGLVRYWELGEAATISEEGIELCQNLAAFTRKFSGVGGQVR